MERGEKASETAESAPSMARPMGPHHSPSAGRSGLGQSVTSFSQDNLRAHDASCSSSDTHHAENVVRAEQTRLFHEELAQKRLGESSGDDDEGRPSDDDEWSSESLKQHKGPRASAETPLRRYVTIGPGEDPFPLYGKQQMKSMPIGYGSLDSVETRREAASAIEQNVERMRKRKHRRTV